MVPDMEGTYNKGKMDSGASVDFALRAWEICLIVE